MRGPGIRTGYSLGELCSGGKPGTASRFPAEITGKRRHSPVFRVVRFRRSSGQLLFQADRSFRDLRRRGTFEKPEIGRAHV